ncbi:uncharacterized protein [Temnothorax nylanderi]|uniref:uncharacterized protein n=1 Tax=Temnothorax nylanderi TaxID=102681 RepID=UPI003A8C1B97
MAERGSGLGVVAEPYRVPPNHACWAVDRRGSVAVTWRMTSDPVACTQLEAGDGYVVVKWGHTVVVGVYVSPSTSVAQYEAYLDGLWTCAVRWIHCPLVVAGDFQIGVVGVPGHQWQGEALREVGGGPRTRYF